MLPSPCRAGGPRADSRQARVLMATHLSDEAAWGGWRAGGGGGGSHAGARFKRRRGSSSVHMRGQSRASRTLAFLVLQHCMQGPAELLLGGSGAGQESALLAKVRGVLSEDKVPPPPVCY